MKYPYDRKVQTRWGKVWAGAVVLLACGFSTGCQKSPDYIPSVQTSREALDTALTAWVNGQPVGPINTVTPPVQVVDNAWWKGQRLTSYEVLGEEKTKEGLPVFSVKLHKSSPQGDETVRYVITGKSPVWVYREDDYKSSNSWEGYK